MNDFRTAAVSVGLVLALLLTQWWAWLLLGLLGAGTALLYALAAASQWRPALAAAFVGLAVLAYGSGQAMTYWLQPERRQRQRAADDALPRVVWRQAIAFGTVFGVAMGLAAWPPAWWLPGPLADARTRLGGASAPVAPVRRPTLDPSRAFPGLDWDRLADGTRYAITQSLNRPGLCPADRGAAFLADCQRYATRMAEVRRDAMSPSHALPASVPGPDTAPAANPVRAPGVGR